jgi:hypothetical protein
MAQINRSLILEEIKKYSPDGAAAERLTADVIGFARILLDIQGDADEKGEEPDMESTLNALNLAVMLLDSVAPINLERNISPELSGFLRANKEMFGIQGVFS